MSLNMTPVHLSKSNVYLWAGIRDVSSLTTADRLGQPFGDNAESWASKIFTSMTYVTRARAAFFEAGFSIEQVALVTGHKDWKMLRRYTHLKPEALHQPNSQKNGLPTREASAA